MCQYIVIKSVLICPIREDFGYGNPIPGISGFKGGVSCELRFLFELILRAFILSACGAVSHAEHIWSLSGNCSGIKRPNAGGCMLLSIVMPVYNEKDTLRKIAHKVFEVELPVERELIIVDDCSTDGTRAILEELAGELAGKPLCIVYHPVNQGKGAAIRTGLEQVSGDVVVIQDADLEYDPAEFPLLLQPVLDGKADAVYGSRFLGAGPHRVLYFWHMIGNKLLTLLSNMFTNLSLTDMETCYKMVRTEIIRQVTIEQNRFGFEPEITAKLARIEGIRIYEVGISYSGRTYLEGKKIGWKDGFNAIWCILKYARG
jgi:glycosyltransferase involved in cell wall biosynthesis